MAASPAKAAQKGLGKPDPDLDIGT